MKVEVVKFRNPNSAYRIIAHIPVRRFRGDDAELIALGVVQRARLALGIPVEMRVEGHYTTTAKWAQQ